MATKKPVWWVPELPDLKVRAISAASTKFATAVYGARRLSKVYRSVNLVESRDGKETVIGRWRDGVQVIR